MRNDTWALLLIDALHILQGSYKKANMRIAKDPEQMYASAEKKILIKHWRAILIQKDLQESPKNHYLTNVRD